MTNALFKTSLRLALEKPLPGLEAQMKMAPEHRLSDVERWVIPGDARLSAVLVLFYPDAQGFHLPMILRNAYKGVHSQQVGLPGGTWEERDGELVRTALRETEEEIGVKPEDIEILGELSRLYIPPSNFLVLPFVGFIEKRPEFVPDPIEVGELIEARFADFQDPRYNVKSEIKRGSGRGWEVPSFNINGHVVWGATAMMMSELLHVVEEI